MERTVWAHTERRGFAIVKGGLHMLACGRRLCPAHELGRSGYAVSPISRIRKIDLFGRSTIDLPGASQQQNGQYQRSSAPRERGVRTEGVTRMRQSRAAT